MTTIRLPIAEAKALADVARNYVSAHTAAFRAIEMIDNAADNRGRSSQADVGDFPRQAEAHADGWIVDYDEITKLYRIRRAPDIARFRTDIGAQHYVEVRAVNQLGGLHDSALLWIGRANAWLQAHNGMTT